jgi:intracellular sulfur oxidation DsrE/DsrF family protein
MRFIINTIFLIAVVLPALTLAGEPETGPVVQGYGPVFAVPEGSFNLQPGEKYKIIMDVGSGPDDASKLNRGIESAARFLNLSVRNGVQPKNLELAVVLHGSGARAALNDLAHNENFEVSNGNKGLIEELGKAGVSIYLCGQTAAYYGYGIDDLLPQVTMAVSAMTAHVRLQQDGYRAILF